MLSSGPGAAVSGAATSLSSLKDPNPQREAAHSHRKSGSASLGQSVQPQQPTLADHSTPSDWFYSTQQFSSSTLPQHQVADSSTSQSMIGPTSTFYEPNSSLHRQVEADSQPYQQWINAYNEQQQFGRDLDLYAGFIQDYSAPEYAQSTANTIITSTPGLYQQQPQQDGLYDTFFNPEPLTVTSNTTATSTPSSQQFYHQSTPDSGAHSYATTPEPTYQQQQAQSQRVQMPQQQKPHIQQAPLQQGQHQGMQQRAQQQQQPQSMQGFQMQQSPHQQQPNQARQQPAVDPEQHHSQQYQQVQPVSPPDQQRPQKHQQSDQSQQSNTTTNIPNGRKQPQVEVKESNLYTTNQLNIQHYRPRPQSNSSSPTSTTRTERPQTKAGSAGPSSQSNGVNGNGAMEGASQGPRSSQALPAAAVTLKRPSPNVNLVIQTVQPPSPSNSTNKRKRRRGNYGEDWGTGEGNSEEESEEDGDGFGGGISVGLGGLEVTSDGRKERGPRLPGACTHCKKLKMKCDFAKNDDTCKRCRAGGHVCIVEGRKPRTAPNKREYLLAQIRQKDAIIESLLKQLHNPYLATPLSIASYRMATSPEDQSNHNVLAWLDRLQSSVRDAGNTGGPNVFTELRTKEEGESDGESDPPAIDFSQDDDGEGDSASSDAEKLRSSLPDTHVPLGLIANLSINNSKAKGKKDRGREVSITEEDLNDDNVGVANETYFMPGPASDLGMRASLIEQHSPPEILVHGLVNPDDVQNLFDIFYKYVNPFISLLDPVLHTPASTFARCPFLFTVVCAISSRYYAEKSEIYPIAMHFAKHSAANALIDGWKSVELCQAYILMSIYAVPARRWEEDRSWLYTGLAIRIATDLNLHQMSSVKPKNEKEEREILNRARAWMICFNLDRSTATQFGKPSTIKEDYIVRNVREWYKKSQYNLNYDVHLCAYSALLQIVAKFHDEIFSDPSAPSGLNKNVDFRSITIKHDRYLTEYHNEWLERFEQSSDPNDAGCAFRCSLLPFLVGYSRLVMFSFGFQQAFQRGIERSDPVFFTKCLDAAKSVIKNMIDGLAPSGYMRYAPDGHFVFASFASAFLLKLLRPEFASLLNKEQENGIFDLIGRLIQTLSSPKIAIDDRHTPKLYARFLAGLLSRHRRDGATVGRLHPNPPSHLQTQPSTGNQIPASSMTTFQVAQSAPQNSHQHDQTNGYSPGGVQTQVQTPDTPIYLPEATYNSGTGPIHFGPDIEFAVYGNSYSPDEEMLATMQAIKNPSWWQNMMMPGFTWTPDPSPSPPHVMGTQALPSYHPNMQHQQHHSMSMPPTMQGGFGSFQQAQVPLL